MNNTPFDNLIGRKVKAVALDNETLTIRTKKNKEEIVFGYEVEGDCCSSSWWSDIEGLHNLRGRVLSVMPVDYPHDLDDDRVLQEYDSGYSFEITTKHGSCVLSHRNSSNGYYGGYINNCSPLMGKNILSENDYTF